MTAGGSAARGLIDGRFELLERLGGGGMGLVWRARDLALEREVALKEVRPAGASVFDDDPVAAHVQRERVLREARALARLHHPNVVTIYHIVDSVEHQYPWLVMELVSGGSLDSRIERAPLSPAETARIGRGVLAALRAAHEAGIQHRDVKPANVLLRADGTPVLTDFGIAALREATALTTTGTVIGSPEYIAPERIRGQEGDPASDLWSLGMLMYVAVEGANPLRRETTLATIAAVLDAPLPEPQRAGPLTAPLAALLVRDPAARIDAARLDQLLAAVQREAGSGNGSGADPRYGEQFPPHSYPPPSYPPRSYPSGSFPPAGQSWSPHDAPPQHWQPQGSVQGQRRRRNRTFVASVTGVAVIGLSAALVWTLHDSSASASTGGGSHATGTPSTAGNAGANSQTTSASPTDQGTGAGDQGTQVNLLTPAGARAAVRALKNRVGSRKIIQLDVYPGYAIAQVLTAADPIEYDEYTYRDGQLDHSPGGTISDEKPFDPGAINWDALPTLLTEAKQRLKVANPTSEYLIIEGNFFGEGPGIGVYISNDYDKGGYMFTDFKGNIIRTVQ
ncbi:MAG TPA: serine/threonine-protein kinase [Actinocrinis sp.]|uniref:serine/threonine-protein kinase n=1 Tax=Actinocrinis sp. TaxID=1920516 RepID=UPI002D4B4B4E|nr:serine/threonine-protein kinase [Actinocrinis sp.]HZU57672.1 serine/threonine-protein kinase [Actinocrinis sp.]